MTVSFENDDIKLLFYAVGRETVFAANLGGQSLGKNGKKIPR